MSLQRFSGQKPLQLFHNKLPEFTFGVLDFLLRYRPNASTIVNEAFIMFAMNKTRDWLAKMDPTEKENLMVEPRNRDTFLTRVDNFIKVPLI